ncbi:hypothetical protein CROQUDRAFT_652072 [Cronartium quercuum f. sp. fusiforme G11]|uniref:AB hydrolase-1 domain-containing protein n=1 Tax=Cronartium quercuum f. sp. fusiforme G11 TaxID=708437 RepID=A0A9P6NRS6_9BASI|nr:hypothetical protein CROQUDRAFT_652072 [Cronartium quercuum f. sp. fusiforme G11]
MATSSLTAPATAAADSLEYPTVLDEKTCVRKGRCPVGKSRGSTSYRIYYEVHGSLEATHKMVFSFNNTCFAWSNQVEYFAKKPDHAVLVFDNRGVGNSDTGPIGLYKTSDMARDVVDLLDFLGWNVSRSLHLIGVSMGGMILQELCLLIPGRIISVVFTSTKAGDKLSFPPLNVVFMFGRILMSKSSPEERMSLFVNRLFPAAFLDAPASDGSGRTNREVKEELLLSHHYTRRPQPLSGLLGQLSAVTSHMCSPEALGRLVASVAPAKILVLMGTADDVVPLADCLKLHSCLPGAELVVWEDGGHALCSQVPERHNRLLERVMQEGQEAIAAASSSASTA